MIRKTLTAIRERLIDPLNAILHDSRSIGIILLACTFLSLVAANVPGSEAYRGLWQTTLPGTAALPLPHSLLHWVNDGLMALFFLLAGMEIKRELVQGELSSFKTAALPAFGAIGGMIVPALLFALLNARGIYRAGWGIPMATDIAFSLGTASLLGSRVPVSLKIFLTALAIIDDLGAILVIALFYGGAIRLTWLGACLAVMLVLLLLFSKKTKPGLLHYGLGILLWYCMYHSGIHATVAGVLFALLIPSRQLKRLENRLHRSVYFFILPLFALANTAIAIPPHTVSLLNNSLSYGIALGLLLGKPLGICGTCYLLVKAGYAKLPQGTGWYKLLGAGWLAGIGFTMSVFIATLAFDAPAMQDHAKIGVLLVSFLAMLAGYFWLRWAPTPSTNP